MSEHITEQNEAKLHLPKFCVVPLQARLNNKIRDGAKIYLGELDDIINRQRFNQPTDKQLSLMKGVSIRTIKEWHAELEREGFIKRKTWREHIKDPEHGIIIRSRREILLKTRGDR